MFQRIEFDDSFLENRKPALSKQQGCAYMHICGAYVCPARSFGYKVNTPNDPAAKSHPVKTLSGIILPPSQKNALVPLTSPGHLQAFPSKCKLNPFPPFDILPPLRQSVLDPAISAHSLGFQHQQAFPPEIHILDETFHGNEAQTLARILLQGWSHFW